MNCSDLPLRPLRKTLAPAAVKNKRFFGGIGSNLVRIQAHSLTKRRVIRGLRNWTLGKGRLFFRHSKLTDKREIMETPSSIIITLIALFASHIATATPIPITSSTGKLIRIQNISVSGTLYDVEFLDGTSLEVYGPSRVSQFTAPGSADIAAAALKATFQSVNFTYFDTHPESINGCDSSTLCYILTAYYLDTDDLITYNAPFVNNKNPLFDSTPSYHTSSITSDTTSAESATWARWSITHATAVPEPHQFILLPLGLLGYLGIRRIWG